MTRKYQDWRGWWDGLRSKAMQAGAESIVANLTGLIGSNGVAAMVPSLHALALTWQLAIMTTMSQFAIRVIFAAAKYVASKPDPDVIVQQSDTVFQSKSPDGNVVTQTHSTTVTTPISTGPKTDPAAGSQPKTQT